MPEVLTRRDPAQLLERAAYAVLATVLLASVLLLLLGRADDTDAPQTTQEASIAAPGPCSSLGPNDGATCESRSAILHIAPPGRASVADDVGITSRLTDVGTVLATTPEGRQDSRMRLTADLQIENHGEAPFVLDPSGRGIYFALAGRRYIADRIARREAGALRVGQRIAAGDSAQGELRFELADGATTRLRSKRRGDIGVVLRDAPGAGRDSIAVLRFKLGA